MSTHEKKYKKYKKKYLNLKNKCQTNPKYIIFAGDTYYPLGGWQDYYGIADTIEEANIAYDNAIKKGWAHVLDFDTGKIILDSWPKTPIDNN